MGRFVKQNGFIKTKYRKSLFWVIGLSICLLLPFFTIPASAASKDSNAVQIAPGQIKSWNDGANVTVDTTGEDEATKTTVTADSTGLRKGYYSSYLYDDTKRSVSAYDGIRFHVENNEDTALKMNLTLTVSKTVSVSLLDQSFAILQPDDKTEIASILYPENGTLMVPGGFSGTLYAPFSQLLTDDGRRVSLTQIQSWGVTGVESEDQIISYTIGKIEFLKNSEAAIRGQYYFITPSGDTQITVPHTGSIIKNYQASVTDLDMKPQDQTPEFFLSGTDTGITITKEGRLEISSDCTASDVTIYVKTEKSLNAGKLQVQLVHENSQDSGVLVPDPSEVGTILSPLYRWLGQSFTWIQGGILTAFLLVAALIAHWFEISNRNYYSIKEEYERNFHQNKKEGKL